MRRAAILAIAAVAFISKAFALAAQESPTASDRTPTGAKRIVVFPYGDPGGFLKPKDAFARYAIPDMIRMELSRQGRFEIVDKEKGDAALEASGEGPEADASPERMRAAALALGADHFVWGSIGSLDGGIGVFHRIAESGNGAIVHESFARLPADEGIFDALQRSVGELGAWIEAGLPLRGPDVVYVEKEVIVERPAPGPEARKKDTGLGIGVDASYRFYAPPFSSWIRPAPRAGLSLDLPADAHRLNLGFSLESSPLFQASGGLMVLGGVTVLQTSLLARLSYAPRLVPSLEARLRASAGGSFFAGFVSPQAIAYFRPSLGVAAGIEWHPLARLGLGIEARAEFTPWAWGSSSMLDIAPTLSIRYYP